MLVHFLTYLVLKVLFQGQPIGSFLGFYIFGILLFEFDELILVQLKEDRIVTSCHCREVIFLNIHMSLYPKVVNSQAEHQGYEGRDAGGYQQPIVLFSCGLLFFLAAVLYEEYRIIIEAFWALCSLAEFEHAFIKLFGFFISYLDVALNLVFAIFIKLGAKIFGVYLRGAAFILELIIFNACTSFTVFFVLKIVAEVVSVDSYSPINVEIGNIAVRAL